MRTVRGTAIAALGALTTGIVVYTCFESVHSEHRAKIEQSLAAVTRLSATQPTCRRSGCQNPAATREGHDLARQVDGEIPEWQGKYLYCGKHNPYVCRRCKREFHALPTSTWQCTTCSGYLVRQ